MNTSHSSDSHVPPIMSFRKHQKSPHLWEWDTIARNTSYFPTPAASLLDCPPPLLHMNSTLPFYSTVRPEESGVGGSQMIGLNLGHRTYFSSGKPLEFASRRCVYSLGHHHQPPRCQAEGCKTDLSGAKHYHRRHKVCELHSKAAVVVAGGMQQRFCQQCSRFHVLAEFDEAKRSCRKRLADHNRRRRKPHGPHLSASTPQISAPKTSNTTANGNNHHTPSTITGISTITSLERERSYQPKAAHSADTTHLSLGGVVEGVEEEGMRWSQSNSSYQHHQELFLVMSDDHKSSSHQHQLLGIPASSTSNTLFHVHGQNLLCNSQEVSQTTGGESDQHQSSLLHLGQTMFETDYM